MSEYLSYASYMRSLFGCRVQKLSIDAGFTCPNRDGTLGKEGCTFCVNDAFNPSYCRRVKSITAQIDEGISFHRWRYRGSSRYLTYFQAYSNTYGPLQLLRSRYEEALRHPNVAGLVIGTRPDCVDEEKLDYLAGLSEHCFIAVEYGIESCYDRTLQRIHRGHTFAQSCNAVEMTHRRGLRCGGHLILGLPGERRDEMLREADILSELPLDTLKLHQLQVLRGSVLERQVRNGSVRVDPFSFDDYVDLVCEFRKRLRSNIIIERYAGEVPPRYQAFPEWAWRDSNGRLLRNETIVQLVRQRLST